MTVGVAGKYSSGKDTAVSVLHRKGFLVIDVDKLGHQALERKQEAVLQRFGYQVRGPDGTVDRKALGGIVFRDRRALYDLEAILHPAMKDRTRELIRENPERNICINAALLFSMGLDQLCDFAIWIEAPCFTRLLRAMKRDRLSLPQLLRRFWSQRKLKPQFSSRSVDIFTVRNTGDPGSLTRKVEDILARRGM